MDNLTILLGIKINNFIQDYLMSKAIFSYINVVHWLTKIFDVEKGISWSMLFVPDDSDHQMSFWMV